jgi:AhpD family alkylhydroperoxidase
MTVSQGRPPSGDQHRHNTTGRIPMTEASQPNPMEVMRTGAPEGARTYLEHRAAIMDNPELQALPLKHKLLVGIGVAAALQSSTCTVQWSKQAVKAGATKEEIVEAILVSRLMKAATVNDTAADALAWLDAQGD